MTIRLYLDEDSMSRSLVVSLRARGIDVVTALDADMIQRSDEEHLQHAMEEGRTLYTFNVSDYYRLHTEYITASVPHAGMILARQQQYSTGEQIRRILKIIPKVSAGQMRDRVEFLSAWS